MKLSIFYFCLSSCLLLLFFGTASAHEHQIFKIGDRYYQFTVGSLNEPVAVDDKTGVDLRVEIMTKAQATEEHGEEEGPLPPATGLEKTLQVELKAGDKVKTLSLSPVFNVPGAYKANFIPTVQTTYAYRFFGMINNTAVDITFTCNPAGHPASPEDRSVAKIANGVERVAKTGAFGCPAVKADLGFPEASQSLHDLAGEINDATGALSMARLLAIGAGVIGLIALYGAFRRRAGNI